MTELAKENDRVSAVAWPVPASRRKLTSGLVQQLAEHYHKSPDLMSEEELCQNFLFLKSVKHYSPNTTTIAICGLKFFFEQMLHKRVDYLQQRAPCSREERLLG